MSNNSSNQPNSGSLNHLANNTNAETPVAYLFFPDGLPMGILRPQDIRTPSPYQSVAAQDKDSNESALKKS